MIHKSSSDCSVLYLFLHEIYNIHSGCVLFLFFTCIQHPQRPLCFVFVPSRIYNTHSGCVFFMVFMPSFFFCCLSAATFFFAPSIYLFFISMLKKLHAAGNRVLVFSQMTALLDILQVISKQANATGCLRYIPFWLGGQNI